MRDREVSGDVADRKTPDPLAQGLAEALRHVMTVAATPGSIDGAGCLLLDADCTLRYVTASGTPAEALEVAEELCVEGPCHEAFAGSDVQYADVQTEQRWSRLSSLLAATPIRTVLGVPIVLDGRSIGAMNAYSALPQAWDAADFDLLHRTAETIAALIQLALDRGLDRHGDALTEQLRAAIANRDRLTGAAEMVMQSAGLDRATAHLRLRQMAAASGQPTIRVAEQVLERGSLPSVMELASDAAAIRRAREEVARMALTDPLTGLANRVLFLDHLEQAIARAGRTGHHPTVLFIDLDRFKTVNDSLGHEAGDEVLRAVADRLTQEVRRQDTVGRLGGDEFAVLCDAPSRPQVTEQLAERIATAIGEPITVTASVPGSPVGREHEVSVRASVGVASINGEQRPRAADILRDADMAMYAAKARGGGQVQAFTDDVQRTGHRRMRLELALRALLEQDQLVGANGSTRQMPEGMRLVYQPIVELQGGRVLGVEALVRWRHRDLGDVGAAELIATAENAGLIDALGTVLLREACRAGGRWRSSPETRQLTVAVNVSPIQLSAPGFVDVVDSVLASSGMEPMGLCLELTESHLLGTGGETLSALHALRRRGVHLTLDDFGTGYSSLSHLARLPLTRLKMDQAFVTDLGGDTPGVAVAASIVALGHSLGLETVAEGVEQPVQRDQLLELGCHLGQGYLFSHPVEDDAVPELLRL